MSNDTIFLIEDIEELDHYDPPAQALYVSYGVEAVPVYNVSYEHGYGIKRTFSHYSDRQNSEFTVPKVGDGFKIGDKFKIVKV